MSITIFFSIFLTIFLAELGDKTQIATLAISGSSQRPLAVFIGSSFALVLASLLGVLLGGSIAKIIPIYKFSSGIKLSVDVDPINFN